MTQLIGILVDVSGSMRREVSIKDKKSESWARSIFKVVDRLIKYDVQSDNKVFAICFGASSGPLIFYLLKTVDNAQEQVADIAVRQYLAKKYQKSNYEKVIDVKETAIKPRQYSITITEIVGEILFLAEVNGAQYIRDWVTPEQVEPLISKIDAHIIFKMLSEDNGFMSSFIKECLPPQCREYAFLERTKKNTASVCGKYSAKVAKRQEKATEDEIREVICKAKNIAQERGCKDKGTVESVSETEREIVEAVQEEMEETFDTFEVGKESVINADKAYEIVHGYDDTKLSETQTDKLLKIVESSIYGRTPMIEALNVAKDLMSAHEYHDHRKTLFVLSDGYPSDEGHGLGIPNLADVNVVCCHITDGENVEPRRLYNEEGSNWDEGAKFMFKLSTSMPTEKLPRTIFVQRGWTIDFEKNATKLFCQINNPSLVEDVYNFARDVVCFQDCLSDALSSISLDLYINDARKRFESKERVQERGEQVGSTCYAFASAIVMHMAMKRIIGREDGCPDFFQLRDRLVALYGREGAKTSRVLERMCPEYRLKTKKVTITGAMKAITEKRPVLATFGLSDNQWKSFENFFKNNPRGILTKKDLGHAFGNQSRHAIVLTSFNGQGLRFMDNYGTEFADGGFFCTQDAEVLGMKFYDVYWDLADLTPGERQRFQREGPTVAGKLFRSLKGLRDAKFTCPECSNESDIQKFSGTLFKVECPSCNKFFDTQKCQSQDLALNIYLTSLCRVTDV